MSLSRPNTRRRFALARLSGLMTLLTLALLSLGVSPAAAQGLFAPVITVNDKVITQYELNQRAKFLTLLRAPGDPLETAREQLIEDRLKLDAAEAAGLQLTDEGIAAGMEEFAGRAQLDTEKFVRAIEGGGVSEETFRAFVTAGLAWRELVRAKFGPRLNITDGDVDRAISAAGSNGSSGVRVLLSEIIIPAPPNRAAAVQARAAQISQITTLSGFAAQARRHSASASRGRGGKLNWMPITQLPAGLRPRILALAPGQVTDPIPISGAIALFQLRAIEETDAANPEYAAIEYAAYYINGGRSEAALARARKVASQIDTCDDLYGIAKGEPESVLERGAKKPAELPSDIALELAKLDKGEVSTNLTRSGGQTLVLLMLCGRTPALGEEVDRESVTIGIQNQRLASYANGYLEQLRADARIVEK